MTDPGLASLRLLNEGEIPSPALLIDHSRMTANIRRMIDVIGDVQRLRPHAKTHKMPSVMKALVAAGISRHKCATLAEAEMCARSGARDILLAYQPVGPSIGHLVSLAGEFAEVDWSTVVDSPDIATMLNAAAADARVRMGVWLDIDVGMHRTGIAPDERAAALYRHVAAMPGLSVHGLHAYDGHIRENDPAARERQCEDAFAPVDQLAAELESSGFPSPRIVAGGSPTFAIHARRGKVECSPGTTVFWDAGYASLFPDLPYQPAALLMTRVISKPQPDWLCLDLGYKAVASESPHPRVLFPSLADAEAVSHSEEHLVIKSRHASGHRVGDVLYGVPWHVCPTVALHQEAILFQELRAVETWQVSARNRRLQPRSD